VRTAVRDAQKAAGVRVDHAIACISGARPRSHGLCGKVDLQGGFVTEADVARVLSACDMPDIGEGREVLHAQPVNFAIDHRSGLTDPRGQIGNTLAADMHLLTVDAGSVRNLLHCLGRCDLELAGLASSAYASGLASLVEDEQELGAACIDLGGGTAGLSIFIGKHMIHADSIRLGGDHIVSDVSKGLQVSRTAAERIKTLHGGAIATGMDDRDIFGIGCDTGDWEHDRRTVSRAELIGIMRPRIEEILEEARMRLDAAGFERLPGQRIVLTGGGSQVPGLDGLAARILGGQIRLGRPLRVRGLPQEVTGPAFSSSVGLCLFAACPQDECWDFDRHAERYSAGSLRGAVKWFKENW